jgi:hypothetical protein
VELIGTPKPLRGNGFGGMIISDFKNTVTRWINEGTESVIALVSAGLAE